VRRIDRIPKTQEFKTPQAKLRERMARAEAAKAGRLCRGNCEGAAPAQDSLEIPIVGSSKWPRSSAQLLQSPCHNRPRSGLQWFDRRNRASAQVRGARVYQEV